MSIFRIPFKVSQSLSRRLSWSVPLLLLFSAPLLAHESWILTPAEMLEWNSKPKLELFTQWSATNIMLLGGVFLFAVGWVRLGFTGAREMFPDLQARLASYGEYSAVILRFALAWTLLTSALAVETRVGNSLFQSPTLLAPDLELRLLGPDWMWLREAQILLGLMFLFGLYVRLAAVILLGVSMLALLLFGWDMMTYLTVVWGVCVYLLLQGPGSHYVPIAHATGVAVPGGCPGCRSQTAGPVSAAYSGRPQLFISGDQFQGSATQPGPGHHRGLSGANTQRGA